MSGVQTRQELLEELARFTKTKSVRMTVVFDGAPEAHFPDGASFQGVKIHYSERNSNADERIKHIAESTKNKNSISVVKNDRALSGYVRSCAVKVLSCQDFRRKMNETTIVETEKKPFDGVKKTELNEWMRYFGVDESDDLPPSKAKPKKNIQNKK